MLSFIQFTYPELDESLDDKPLTELAKTREKHKKEKLEMKKRHQREILAAKELDFRKKMASQKLKGNEKICSLSRKVAILLLTAFSNAFKPMRF